MTGLRVRAGNDANVAALGEAWKGGGEGCRSAVFITLGTGVGGGVVINGKVVSGAHGAGGEIGHITVPDPEKAPCSCGKCGCLEQYASANGIVRVTKKRLLEMDTESLLRGASTITCKDVFDAARQQDAFAVETLELILTIWARQSPRFAVFVIHNMSFLAAACRARANSCLKASNGTLRSTHSTPAKACNSGRLHSAMTQECTVRSVCCF